MSDIAIFWGLKSIIDNNETIKKEAQKYLNEYYPQLIEICPHSEAIEWDYKHGQGVFRVCIICGIEDHASEGGTPGDEYDYGYPGYPSRAFWQNTHVRKAEDEKEFSSYRRQHNWRVRNGKAYNPYA